MIATDDVGGQHRAQPNVLYQAPQLLAAADGPAKLFARIMSEASGPDALIADLLMDPAVEDAVWDALHEAYASFHRARSVAPRVRGALGFALMIRSVDQASAQVDDRLRRTTEATQYLRDPAVQHALRVYYASPHDNPSLDSYDLSQAVVHRVGTTSFLLDCRTIEASPFAAPTRIALKCLLPRYMHMQSIRDSAAMYALLHPTNSAHAPRVYASTDRYIAMDFVAGPTLSELFEERRSGRVGEEVDVSFVRSLGVALCEVLAELQEDDRHHLDLSPSNVIVVDDDLSSFRVKLIDFGRNHLLTERVGSTASVKRAALYVAPELLENPGLDDVRCDLFSLGMILLEAAGGRELDREDPGETLLRLWETAPGLGRTIEDLVEADADKRLALAPEPLRDTPYRYVKQLIEQETQVLLTYKEATGIDGFGLLRGLDLVKLGKNAQIMNIFRAAQAVTNPVDETYSQFPRLGRWAIMSHLGWAIAFGTFLALTLADLGFASVSPVADVVKKAFDAPFQVGDVWANLPGRLVALTFSLTAVTYYVNIYSTLSPRSLPGRLPFVADLTMRSTAVGLTIPILWAMLYDPRDWPLCAGFGTLLVVLNNFVCHRIALVARQVGRSKFSTQIADEDRFIEHFGEWWQLMGYYSVTMIAIGFLLIADVATDERLFGYLVAFINVQKMYRLNCTRLAPWARGNLARSLFTLRRAAALDGRRV